MPIRPDLCILKLKKQFLKGGTGSIVLNLRDSHEWYDFSIKVVGQRILKNDMPEGRNGKKVSPILLSKGDNITDPRLWPALCFTFPVVQSH